MRFEVPFFYDIRYVKPRHRTPDTTLAPATAFVDIPEVTGAAHLAFEAATTLSAATETYKRESVFYSPSGVPFRTYAAEGAFWVEIVPLDEAQDFLNRRLDEMRDPFNVNSAGSEKPSRADQEMTRKQVEDKEGKLRSWDESGQDSVRTALQRRAAEDMRIVDGRLCMRISEPCLYFNHEHFVHDAETGRRGREQLPDKTTEITSLLIIDQVRDETPGGFSLNWSLSGHGAVRWRLDEKAKALEFLDAQQKIESLARERAGNADRVVVRPVTDQVTIASVDTRWLACEGDTGRLMEAIRRAGSHLDQRLSHLHADVMPIVLELRHAREQSGDRLTPGLLALARRLSEVIDAKGIAVKVPQFLSMTMGGNQQLFESDTAMEGALADTLRHALLDWDTRPRDGREWLDRMSTVPVVPYVLTEASVIDVVEIASTDAGRKLIEDGCDPAVEEYVAEAAAGRGHLVTVETVTKMEHGSYRQETTGFAAYLTGPDDDLRVERIFAPGSSSPSDRRRAEEWFAFHVSANASASAEDDALTGLSMAL